MRTLRKETCHHTSSAGDLSETCQSWMPYDALIHCTHSHLSQTRPTPCHGIDVEMFALGIARQASSERRQRGGGGVSGGVAVIKSRATGKSQEAYQV